MNTSNAEMKEIKDTEGSPEKQPKKIRTSPPIEGEKDKYNNTLISTNPLSNTSNPPSTSPAFTTTNNHNTTARHEKDTTDESLYHKKASKQVKLKNKRDSQWGSRVRSSTKPTMMSDEEPDESNDLPLERDPSPPSSPHPTEDVPLETLLKHGSGWAFPREQNGKMICIFRSCPQPLRAGTRKDYVDHLRLHQTMEHTPLYSMLRKAPPGGLLPSLDASGDEEAPMSQVDGEWEGDEDEEEGEDAAAGDAGAQGIAPGQAGVGAGAGEEELHTPKLSQRGLQLRAQMMKYGLNIFRQDSEGRYLCFFMGCTMRMTTNFSRHIAKHEKKMDAISPDLVHLLKEGSTVDKPYVKGDKKAKDGSPLTLMMASSAHLIPPPHHGMSHHSMEGMEMGESHGGHHSSHHSLMSSLEIQREYRAPSHIHMQQSLQHMHLQHSSPPPPSQYMPPHSSHMSKLNLPPPPHPLSHSQGYSRHPPPLSHLDVHRGGTSGASGSLSPSPSASEIRWVYRSPLPSPLSLPMTSPRRSSLTPDSDSFPHSHSPIKHGFTPPPVGISSSPRNPLSAPSPSLSRLSASEGESPHDPSLIFSISSTTITPLIPDLSKSSSPSLPSLPPPSHPELSAVATSLLDLRKM